ncbi:Uncharacterized protein APZ42_027846 [Daphnia magna]|uniref:Uncharacterized protein n=1 Tax=Daphnia magna TaxID=35525 RepID=A0A164R178_9CRUS|nr:Uncharacterized protein APZ42_027846 [Daphnia magna]
MLRRISAVIPLVLLPNIENELKFMKGFYLMITSRGTIIVPIHFPNSKQSTTYGKAFGDVAQAFLDTHKTSEKFLFETCNAANQDPDGTNKQAVAENNQYPNSAFEMDFLNSGIEEELITLNNTVPASTTMSIMVPVAPAQPVFSYDTYPSILAFTALPISFASPPPDLDAISKAKELSKTLSPVTEVIPCSQQTGGETNSFVR